MSPWRALSDFYFILHRCRFAFLLVGAAGIAVLATDQGQELFRTLGEDLGSFSGWLRVAALGLATLFLALQTWYFGRVVLSFGLGEGKPSARIRTLATWVPRGLGVSTLLLVAAGFGVVALNSAAGGPRPALSLLALSWFLLAGGFLCFVYFRRRLLARVSKNPEIRTVPVSRYRALPDLHRETKVALAIALAVDLVAIVAFTLFPVSLGPSVGALAITFAAAGAWMLPAAAAAHGSHQSRLPLLLFLAAWVVLISPFNDNHQVTTLRKPVAARMDLHHRFHDWLCALTKTEENPTVYFVATEGGGIRAAYWTAGLLGRIEDEHPGFANHTFAISSVSGGSLGAGVFAAALADRSEHLGTGKPLGETARGVLGHDFLSPTVAKLLYPDLLARFIPWRIPFFDRATAVEEVWARRWKETTGTDRFRQAFTSLWTEPGAHNVPLVLLNAAWVEGGNRFLIAPTPGGALFEDARDGLSVIGEELSLATSVHLSARFPYVSPAATVQQDGRTWGHVVDGGYFENSGAATALDVLDLALRTTDCGCFTPAVVVIQYRDDPDGQGSRREEQSAVRDCPALTGAPAPLVWVPDLLAPPVTLINTRDARARSSMDTLLDRTRIAHGTPICALLYQLPGELHLPLGWLLSNEAQAELDKKLSLIDLSAFSSASGAPKRTCRPKGEGFPPQDLSHLWERFIA
jgi:hypothetical protein